MQACFFEFFENASSCPSIMIISPLYKTLMLKVLESTCRKVWCLSACKKINFISNLFFKILWRHFKLAILGLREYLTIPIKNYTISLHTYLHATNQLHYSLLSSDIEKNSKLVIIGVWACLVTHTENDSINMKKSLMFICKQKIKFILPVFIEILQSMKKLLFWVLWKCLNIHIKNRSINLREFFIIFHMHAKNQLYQLLLS